MNPDQTPVTMKRELMQREGGFDTKKFFDVDIDTAIAYLKSLKEEYTNKDISISQIQYGYEDHYIAVCYEELENDNEYESRIAEIEMRNEDERKKEKKKDYDAKYAKELKTLRKKYSRNE